MSINKGPSALVNGVAVYIGDCVSFKCDIEQCGTVIAIHGDDLTLERPDGFDGGYIGGDTTTIMEASRCWID